MSERKQMATKIIKMRSGEEVVADVTESIDGLSVLLKNPCMFVPVRRPEGNSLAMVPWSALIDTDQPVSVPVDGILFTAEPLPQLLNEYNSQFGGLVVPMKPNLAVPTLKLTDE
jgi:hypothetical protein